MIHAATTTQVAAQPLPPKPPRVRPIVPLMVRGSTPDTGRLRSSRGTSPPPQSPRQCFDPVCMTFGDKGPRSAIGQRTEIPIDVELVCFEASPRNETFGRGEEGLVFRAEDPCFDAVVELVVSMQDLETL